jgi:hypothetical protein
MSSTATSLPKNQPSTSNNEIANLSIEKLQQQLKKCWVRYEKSIKEEMAPRLYYLRDKLKKQGSRTGEGFAQWVKANLGLSLSTVNRWADDYAVEQGLKEPKNSRDDADGSTSSHLTRSAARNNDEPIDEQFTVELTLSPERRDCFQQAMQVLGPDESSEVMFNAVVTTAEKKFDELAEEHKR